MSHILQAWIVYCSCVVYCLSLYGVRETQSQRLRFNGGGVSTGPVGTHYCVFKEPLHRFTIYARRRVLTCSIVHRGFVRCLCRSPTYTEVDRGPDGRRLPFTLTQPFRLPRYHPCCDFPIYLHLSLGVHIASSRKCFRSITLCE